MAHRAAVQHKIQVLVAVSGLSSGARSLVAVKGCARQAVFIAPLQALGPNCQFFLHQLERVRARAVRATHLEGRHLVGVHSVLLLGDEALDEAAGLEELVAAEGGGLNAHADGAKAGRAHKADD